MLQWRIGRGWTRDELATHLADAARRNRSFAIEDGLSSSRGWSRHASTAVIAREAPGRPERGGPFERAWALVQAYAFSDPRLVRGHFDPAAPLDGRRMLLEIRVLGLRFLGGAVVGAVRDEADARRTVRGFRYDTLEGHVERGCEWFLVTKDHATGEISFAIRAVWQRGDIPGVLLRIGFNLVVRRYQRAWHRLAHLRLRGLLGSAGLAPLPRSGRLVRQEWGDALAPAQAAAAGPPHDGITAEREEPAGGPEDDEMRELARAFGMGIVSGSRSMLAPALVAHRPAGAPGPCRDGRLERMLSSAPAARLLPLLAAGELVGDKLPWTPARISTIPLLGRIGSGALVGAAIAAPRNRAAGACAGAAGALAGAYALYYLRRAATGRGVPGPIAAVAEDALAIGAGLLLTRGHAGRPRAV